jgi:fibronectin type 3 domain-containing protein
LVNVPVNQFLTITESSDKPLAPRNLRATAGDRQITLTWTANSEADFLRYRIYGGTSPNPAAIVDSVQGSANTSKTLTGLSNGTTYFYRLTAVDLALNASGFSNEVSATPTAGDLPPAIPQNVQTTVGVAQVTLTWSANTEADFLRYRIYGGTNPNPTTKIDSVEGANSTTKTITNLTVGVTYYFRLTAVDQALHASGYSSTVSAKPLADNTAPALANAVYSEPANLNSEVAVAIAATDASGIKNVWLYYRVAGAATFSNRLMTRQNDNTYTQSIPAAAITNKGAEFYVRAEDTYGNVAQTRLHPVRVYCPNGIANPAGQPSGTAASFYRLISIPLALDDKSPAMFLTTNSSLGAYDNTKYRWYGLERATQTLREYPNFGNIQLTPDMGFALLVNIRNVKLKTSSGTTVNTTVPYNIALPAGWSLIGNPFNFNIPFDSLRVSTGRFELWRFEGDWQINTAGLEPWKGYAIWLSEAATFSIRPGVAGLKSATSFYSVANNDAENWLVQIIADNGRSAEAGGASRFNFAGQSAGATDNEDALDLHEPVRLADGVEVVFTKENSASLKADIRQPSSNGHAWDFICRLNPEDEVLSLTFDGVATVPQAFDIFVLEPETATAYDLRANPRLQFATRHLTEKRFQLVAGTKAYLHEQSLPAELHPSSFELLQNFPNPFNPVTQIIYSLPEASHVEVSVYNVRGERVATLVNERQESGSHTVVWNAEKVGSGVYFIRMQAGRVAAVKKCVLLK